MFANPKLSMQVFGFYLIALVGVQLMLIPHIMLDVFGLHAGDDAWIRMVGMLASIIGTYYVLAAKSGMKRFYRWSVPLRIYAGLFMVLLFILGYLPIGIVFFGAIDICGALWTWAALRSGR